jgi:hypothetical protein
MPSEGYPRVASRSGAGRAAVEGAEVAAFAQNKDVTAHQNRHFFGPLRSFSRAVGRERLPGERVGRQVASRFVPFIKHVRNINDDASVIVKVYGASAGGAETLS